MKIKYDDYTKRIINSTTGEIIRYNLKYCNIPGHKKQEYTCPRRNKFGIELFGEGSCRYCKYCGFLRVFRTKYISLCCHPIQVNEITNPHPGYECNVTILE